MDVLQAGDVSTSPNPQAGGRPLFGCPRLLIQFIRSYPLYRRPFLYPQPEDAPCRGDRDPLHMAFISIYHLNCRFSLFVTNTCCFVLTYQESVLEMLYMLCNRELETELLQKMRLAFVDFPTFRTFSNKVKSI